MLKQVYFNWLEHNITLLNEEDWLNVKALAEIVD